MATSVYQQGGYGTAALFPGPIYARRDPTSTDRVSPTGQPYQVFQGWNNELTDACFMYLGGGNWVTIASVVGSLTQLTGNTGTALPAAGSIAIVGSGGVTTSASGSTITISLNGGSVAMDSFVPDAGTNPVVPTALGAVTMAGTANQITTTGGTNVLTFSLSATLVGPGSITATSSLAAGTTVTAGTGVTATTGNITATNGNLVLGTAGNKLSIATGANASTGTATLVGGTVTVATTAVEAGSLIHIWRQSIGATGAAALGQLTVGTITAATSFVINAVQAADATALQATDVSVVGWMIVN